MQPPQPFCIQEGKEQVMPKGTQCQNRRLGGGKVRDWGGGVGHEVGNVWLLVNGRVGLGGGGYRVVGLVKEILGSLSRHLVSDNANICRISRSAPRPPCSTIGPSHWRPGF
jgi:hypothetical protein